MNQHGRESSDLRASKPVDASANLPPATTKTARSSFLLRLASQPAEVRIPSTIGNVTITREIGRGGMGVVFDGWDKILHRQVAVKFLVTVVAHEDDPALARFFAGARLEAAVRHPNIVTIHSAGIFAQVPYIIMDYVDGPTLRKIAKPTAPMSITPAVKAIWDISDAVRVLHVNDVIHRDLKPGNVLLDREGHLYVSDFGLAELSGGTEPSAGPLGTVGYMSPEMFDGRVSHQSDVYAMGIMLFELLAGRLPFVGDLDAIREQHIVKPLPLDLLPECTPPTLVEIIERAAHKNALFRHKSARHFQQALRGVVTDDLLQKGETELNRLVLRFLGSEPTGRYVERSEDKSTATYYERLGKLAQTRRTQRTSEHAPEGLPYPKAVPSVSQAHQLIFDRRPTGTTLAIRLPCVSCQYDLRSLPLDSRCPECGAQVRESTKRDRLLFASPSWLKKVAHGLMTCVVVMVVGPAFILVVNPLLNVWFFKMLRSGVPIESVGWVLNLSRAIPVALAAGVFLISVLMASAPEPGRQQRNPWIGIAGVTRVLTLAAALVLLVFFRPMVTPVPMGALTVGVTIAISGSLVSSFLLCLAGLCKRLPARSTALLIRCVAFGTAFLAALLSGFVCAGSMIALESVVPERIREVAPYWVMVIVVTDIVLIWAVVWHVGRRIRQAKNAHVPYGALLGGSLNDGPFVNGPK